jgi:hypothetical protein
VGGGAIELGRGNSAWRDRTLFDAAAAGADAPPVAI